MKSYETGLITGATMRVFAVVGIDLFNQKMIIRINIMITIFLSDYVL